MTAAVCPIVGTTNDVLPPQHPTIDMDKPGQTCPVVGATTDHHNLTAHPPVSSSSNNAISCPVMKQAVKEPQAQMLDDKLCPVVGTATTILPPDHPNMAQAKESDVCPVTKASVGNHKNKVATHPSVEDAPEGAVCPVTKQVSRS